MHSGTNTNSSNARTGPSPRWPYLLLSITCITACGDKDTAGSPADEAVGDTASDTGALDDADAGSAPDAPQTDASATDATADANAPLCPGEAGCPCKTSAECDDLKCIETPNGAVCARKCVDDCPAGFKCVLAAADTASFCYPSWGLLCRPCSDSNSCKKSGLTDTFCVDYAGNGGFCGAFCENAADCPADYVCKLTATVDSGSQKQCVRESLTADFGECPCSPTAVAGNLSTKCWVPWQDGDKQLGQCIGERVCKAAGLTACTALAGSSKKCIETGCADKKEGAVCDDANACTVGDKCVNGACLAGPNQCECDKDADCPDDGDLCNGTRYCDTSGPKNTCETNAGSVVSCTADVDTACNKNSCDPKAGKCAMKPTPANNPCDDGDPCSGGDLCDGKGGCSKGTKPLCACLSAKDCLAKDDGNLCNGVWYCDTTKAPFACVFNPASVVQCPQGGVAQCAASVCAPSTGKCATVPAPKGATCTDNDKCTEGEICDGKSACGGGVDVCICSKNADCIGEEDGNACNGTMYCNKATNKCALNPASVVSCPSVDDTFCRANGCDTKTGACVFSARNEGLGCSDGDPCTDSEVCKSGACSNGESVCFCANNADCAKYAGGDLCHGSWYCDKSGTASGGNVSGNKAVCRRNPTTAVVCPTVDNTACKASVCAVKTGKCEPTARNENGACEADGNPCTVGDVCKAGSCVVGANKCACQADADCVATAGQDLCLGPVYCDKSESDPKKWSCAVNSAQSVACPSSATPCVSNLCIAATGKCKAAFAADNNGCDDGDACSGPDSCKTGKCVGGPSLCKCGSDADCAAFDDGNSCTADKCNAGKCESNAATDGQSCSDGDKCTVKDGCKSGVCSAGPNTGCPKCAPTETVCDGKDEDCDGATDEGCDGDGDQWCDAAMVTVGKPQVCPNGGGDCDDKNKAVKPGVQESCDGVDNDCNGKTDEDFSIGKACDGADADKCADGVRACGKDGKLMCDEKASTLKKEACNGKDDDCDGETDEKDAEACTLFYKDVDGDGRAQSTVGSGCYCTTKETLSLTAVKLGDCDDGNKAASTYSWTDAKGKVLAVGDSCVVGACGAGAVKCDGKLAACVSDGTPLPGSACCASLGGTYGGSCLWTDSKGVKWGLIPSGTFWMGCNPVLDKSCSNADGNAENAQHEVEVTEPYWLGIFEVTVAQYKACVDASKCTKPAHSSDSFANWAKAGREQHPVNFVHRSQASTYCQWVGGYLPTEAQWELAARGRCGENGGISGCAGKMRVYPWGNETATCAYAVMNDKATTGSASGTNGCGEDRTWAVGSKPKGAGPYGTQDMAGNVWEWVADWYAYPYPSAKISQAQGGTGPSGGSLGVVRGGGFYWPASNMRAGRRGGYTPSKTDSSFGFRCARSFP